MNKFWSLVAAALLLSGSGTVLAQAGLQASGEAKVTNSWEVPQSCGSCGISESMEMFIVEDTGAGPFDPPGLRDLPAGWSASTVNPNYVLATGPAVEIGFWTEQYLGDITESVTINLIMWTGRPQRSPIAFAASYSRSVNGGLTLNCQAFDSGCPDMLYPDGIGYDRRSSVVTQPVPVLSPIGLLLLLVALGGAGAWNVRRRQRA